MTPRRLGTLNCRLAKKWKRQSGLVKLSQPPGETTYIWLYLASHTSSGSFPITDVMLHVSAGNQTASMSSLDYNPAHIALNHSGASCKWWTQKRVGPWCLFELCLWGPKGLRPKLTQVWLRGEARVILVPDRVNWSFLHWGFSLISFHCVWKRNVICIENINKSIDSKWVPQKAWRIISMISNNKHEKFRI